MRWVVAVVLAAPLLAGCTGGPPGSDGAVGSVELTAFQDDYYCDGHQEVVALLQAKDHGGRATVFNGSIALDLERKPLAGFGAGKVDSWDFNVTPENFTNGYFFYLMPERDFQTGASYHLTATVRVAGQAFSATADFAYRGAFALARGTCAAG